MEEGFNKLRTGIFIEHRLNQSDIEQLTKCKRSKRVVLTGLKLDTIEFLLPLKELEDLNIYSCSIKDWTALQKFSKLKKLFINTVKKEIDNFSFLSNLNTIEDLGICYATYFYSFPDLSQCENLKTIRLFQCNNLSDISKVAVMPHLEHFSITSKLIKPEDLEFIMQKPTIKTMSGAFGGKKTDDEFMNLLTRYGIQYG